MQTRRLLLEPGLLQLALLKLRLLSQRLPPAGQLQRLLQVGWWLWYDRQMHRVAQDWLRGGCVQALCRGGCCSIALTHFFVCVVVVMVMVMVMELQAYRLCMDQGGLKCGQDCCHC